MPEKPVSGDDLQELYIAIAKVLESFDGREAQMSVARFSVRLFEDMRSEAEVRMLMYGQGTSDRFLFGLCSAVLAMREENGGSLPQLSDGQYELDREVQDSHQAAQDDIGAAYFHALELTFENRFPLTATLLQEIERDLRTRLMVPEIDIQEGFIPGWYKAVKATIPLFPLKSNGSSTTEVTE